MTTVVDPWLLDADGNPDPFSRVDFSLKPEDAIDPDAPMLDIHPGLAPEIVIAGPPAPSDPEPIPLEPETPETVDFDGGTATLEKEKGQWKLTVSSGTGGQPQVYWGKTKNELLLQSMAKAQLNATIKIRDLNKKVKLGNLTPKPAQVQNSPVPQSRALTADEIFEIKTQLGDNPDLAIDNWFAKKTGLSVQQLVTLAQKGANAEANLETEAVCKEFLFNNPDYYGDKDNQNFKAIVFWLAKYKLNRAVADPISGMYELHSSGYWTVENLEEAFEDLSQDDLLIKAPRQPKPNLPSAEPPPPVEVHPEPVPAPRPDSRIVKTETRPRAALGIRPSDVTPVAPPATPTAPSDEDLNSMTDAQIKELYQGVRRSRMLSRRSN